MTIRKYNNGEWTPARFHSFIKSALRSASIRWPVKYGVLKEAAVGKQINQASGRMAEHYKCNACNNIFPRKEVEVNHKEPVVPLTGFVSWDDLIDRMFCEKEGLEVLCKPCHKNQTQKENTIRKQNATK